MVAQKDVNLLTTDRFEYTPLGKVLNWSLTAGRLIAIITVFIVFGSFLAAIFLDRKLNNLRDQNASIKAQVEATQKFEKQFREIQERLRNYQTLTQLQTYPTKILDMLTKRMPTGLVAHSIKITQESISVTGTSNSELELSHFINALRHEGLFENVNLASVKPSGGGRLEFTVEAQIPNQQK